MHSFAWWPTLVVVLIATATDLRWRRIPNWLVLPFLIAGFAVSGWFHGWDGIGQSAEGMALGLFVFGLIFWVGGMGAGDVKLCAAIGAWVGPQQMLMALIFISLAGGLMAIVWSVVGGFAGELFQETGNLVLGGRKAKAVAADAGTNACPAEKTEAVIPKRRKMPYAPAIAIGTLLSFFAH